MHKKLLVYAFFFILLLPAVSHASYIGTNNGVYKFQSRVLKCEAYNSTTEAWVTLWDYTSNTGSAPTVDIGAGSVGSQMGTYLSGISIPVGTYTQMRVTISTIVALRGWALSSGTYYYTDSSDPIYQTGSQASTPSDATCTEITLSPPSGSGIPTTMVDTVTITGGGLVVAEGQSRGLSIIFPMEQLFSVQNVGVENMIMPRENTPTVSPQ